MAEHDVVKPEVIVATAAELIEAQLVVPALFKREGIDKFKGAKDDTINVKVPGVLPYRTYGWRNARTESVVFDEYAERKFGMTFGDDTYSGVRLTDEQNEMDLDGWTELAGVQADAIVRGLQQKSITALNDAPYEVKVVLDRANLSKSLIRLRRVMNALRVQGSRKLVIGGEIEEELLNDTRLNLAQNVGESEAVSALKEATLGRRYGFDFVVAEELAENEGTALVDNGFVFLNAAPGVPQSVPFGATVSTDGIALRWIRDYETEKQQDRSLFTTWNGFEHVKDVLVGTDETTKQSWVSTTEHFVRAVKVELGDALDVEIDNAELSTIIEMASTDGVNDGA